MLTPAQNAVLRFVIERIDATGGTSPSLREIAAHLNLRSTSGVCRILQGLEERKFIKRPHGRARNIIVRKRPPAPKAASAIALRILQELDALDVGDRDQLMILTISTRAIPITGAELCQLCNAVTGASDD